MYGLTVNRKGRIVEINCLCQRIEFMTGHYEYIVSHNGCPFHAPEAFLKNLKLHLDAYEGFTHHDGYAETKKTYEAYKRYLETGRMG